MNKIVTRPLNFVRRHKNVIAVSVIAIVVISTQDKHIRELNDFLEDNDLLKKYYAVEES